MKHTDHETARARKPLLERVRHTIRTYFNELKIQRAQKALLTILKIDDKNATAYNRLGILYAKGGKYKEAAECFETVIHLEPSASAMHNLGLIKYEVGDYEGASNMFKNALKMEDGLAARYIAFAKVQEKLGNTKGMITALENAFRLEPVQPIFDILYMTYKENRLDSKAEKLAEAFHHEDSTQKDPYDALVKGTKELVNASKEYNRKLDRIAAKHGL